MADRIDLPKVTVQKDAKAHSFPLQIALQTQEFIQGVVFYFIIIDKAAGEFVRLPNGLDTLRTILLRSDMKNSEWESGWNYLEKYKDIFKNAVFQNALISIRSHWDWYANKLAGFIIYSQDNLGNPLAQSEIKQLRKITYKEIVEQVEIMENSCSLDFNISEETKRNIKEMSLVRNLGLHNRWEVDQQYLEKTTENNKFKKGDIRDFDAKELISWHKDLINIIGKIYEPIAIKYVSVPMYPPAP